MLNPRTGRWESRPCSTPVGYICESRSADAGKSLEELTTVIREDFRSWKPRISHLQMDTSLPPERLFGNHEDRFGLRRCVDGVAALGTPRAIWRSELQAQDYRQTYHGIPVHGRGYVAHLSPQTKEVVSLTGRLEHGIEVETAPTFPEAAAYRRAVRAIGAKPSDYGKGKDRPAGELVVYPVRQGPRAEWELAWVFSFPALPARPAYGVVVSAQTGRTLFASDWLMRQCGSVNISDASLAPAPADITVDAFQQTILGDPNGARGTALTNPSGHPFALYSSGIIDPSTGTWFQNLAGTVFTDAPSSMRRATATTSQM